VKVLIMVRIQVYVLEHIRVIQHALMEKNVFMNVLLKGVGMPVSVEHALEENGLQNKEALVHVVVPGMIIMPPPV